MKKIIPLFFFLYVFKIGFGQNLVPNGSFEDTVGCPTGGGQTYKSVGWSSCKITPDYFNSCADSISYVTVPYNMTEGYQYPRTGSAFMGTITHFTPGTREIFGRQLSSPLLIGQRYYVSFYVNCAYSLINGTCLATNKTGVLFSTILYSSSNPAPINNFAHVFTDSIITDTLNWVAIRGSFIADSSYNYIMFGNFFDDAHTDTIQLYQGCGRAYYFYDDICVSTDSFRCISITEGMLDTHIDNNITLSPNPTKDNFTISFSQSVHEPTVMIFNNLGEKVYEKNVSGVVKEIPIHFSVAAGVYFLKVWEGEKQYVQKIMVE